MCSVSYALGQIIYNNISIIWDFSLVEEKNNYAVLYTVHIYIYMLICCTNSKCSWNQLFIRGLLSQL